MSLCLTTAQARERGYDNYLYRCNEKLIEVIMEDLFTPPVASRVQVYPNIAAYEVLAIGDPQLLSLSHQFKHLLPLTLKRENINYSIAAEFAFTTVAKKLVFSEYLISEFEIIEKNTWREKAIDSTTLSNSIRYGVNAGNMIINWLQNDNYAHVKTLERYVLSENPGAWQPTPPEFSNAVEPNWHLLRTLVTDSSSQFIPKACTPYSEQKNSNFYKEAYAVYKTGNSLNTTEKSIAQFWDCNPNISISRGHLTYFIHKISPGGHWIKIAGQACKNLSYDEYRSAETYTLLSIAIYEGFISCWTEKFKVNLIRPETYINKLIDPKWEPYLQTPPFPEFPSGHSVISNASAFILTQLIPQPYAFTDSSEIYINLPARRFPSFEEAAKEASLSRFYGGIHFMPAIENGAEQGKALANYIFKNIHTRK